MEGEFMFFAMECKDCGWDWMSNFTICPNCNSHNVDLIEEEDDEKMYDRMYWMNIKNIKGFYDPQPVIKEINRMFGYRNHNEI